MQAILSEIDSGRKAIFQAVESIGERIKRVRKSRHQTQHEFAAELGVTRGAVGNWELGGEVSADNLAKIADRYEVSLDWLQRAIGEPPQAVPTVEPPSSARAMPNARMASQIDLENMVPLMGQGAAGPDGRFPFNGEIITQIPAPPRLARVRGAYALYVVGDSMEERYFNGEVVFVDPHRRVGAGNFVVAQIAGAEGDVPSGYIKRLVVWDGRELRLEQFNPRKVLKFPGQRVVSVHRIVMGGEE